MDLLVGRCVCVWGGGWGRGGGQGGGETTPMHADLDCLPAHIQLIEIPLSRPIGSSRWRRWHWSTSKLTGTGRCVGGGGRRDQCLLAHATCDVCKADPGYGAVLKEKPDKHAEKLE